MESSWIALIIIGAMLILYMTELLPIATTSILACVALAVFGVIPLNMAFAGFGNDIVFLIVGMMVVGDALFETGVAHLLGKKIISVVGANEKLFIAALITVCITIGMFLSNTATAAIMLPIAASAIAASGGKLSKKNTYMVIGFAAVAGGGLTVIGSTPQLIAQGILLEGGHETMGFFELSYAGIPKAILLLVYYLTIGYALQKKVFTFPEPPDEPLPDKSLDVRSPKNTVKMCTAVGALVFCVVGFLSDLWTVGIVAMIGALLCVVTGCITQKRVFQKMEWTTVIIMGCSFGLAAGLDQSGAGRLIAQAVISILGDNISPWLICSALALLAVILGNIMSHTATASLLVPISVILALELGYDVKSLVMAVVIAANVTYMTPISTPPITMTLAGGYRFMDYVKVGGIINVLSYILIVLLFPLVLNI